MRPTLAFAARDLRKYFRRPHLIAISVVLPLLQFVVIGHSFGGKIRQVPVAVMSYDTGPPALDVLERLRAVESTTGLLRVDLVRDEGEALRRLRRGEVVGAVIIEPDYSARIYRGESGGIGVVVDNTDLFVAGALEAGLREVVARQQVCSTPLPVVELFPFVDYLQYLIPGAVMAAIYIVCFIGGGISFVDDKVTGRQEGYLATPVRSYQILGGLIAASAVKAFIAAIAVTPLALWIAGCVRQLTIASAIWLTVVLAVSALAAAGFLTALTIRLRSVGGIMFLNSVANMVLFFPSGALYPVAGFPWWLQGIAKIDPFTYVVRPIRMVLFKHGYWEAISGDVLTLAAIGVASFLVAWAAFPRKL